MKIIKKGDLQLKESNIDPLYKFECRFCGCIFECNRSECLNENWRNELMVFHECPTCKERIGGKQLVYRGEQ